MKARVIKHEEKVLYYGLGEEKASGLIKLCDELSIVAQEIPSGSTGQQVGRLAGWEGFKESPDELSCPESIESCECLIFCGIGGQKMNTLLSQLRLRGLSVDLKAAVTQYNQRWRFCDLLGELIKEHKQMHGLI